MYPQEDDLRDLEADVGEDCPDGPSSAGDTDGPDDEDVARILRNLASDCAELDHPVATGELWLRRRRLLPAPVVDFLLCSVRLDVVRESILRAAEAERLVGVPNRARDAALIEAKWRDACSRDRLRTTLRSLRRIRDQVVRTYHQGSCYQHVPFGAMPALLKKWRPKNGVLIVDDLPKNLPSIGYASFLEPTPPQLGRYVYETRRARILREATGTTWAERGVPGVWDVTAGSGMGHDLFCRILGCHVVSTDLTSCNEVVQTLDAREVGTIVEHGRTTRDGIIETTNAIVRAPDIVLFDPPSRGSPTHSECYSGEPEPNDIGSLKRDAWVEFVTGTVKNILPKLASHGVVSLLVRHGVRDHGRVTPDGQLLADVKRALEGHVSIIEEVRVEYRNRVRQTELGTERVPSTHLLLARKP